VISLNFIFTVKRYSFNFNINKKPLAIIAGLLIIVSIILTPGNQIFRIIGFNSAFGTGLYTDTYPINMYNFIRENKINEIGKRPFQTLDYGGYFIWNFPGSKNFIDSRNLNDSIYDKFMTIRDKKTGFNEQIRECNFDIGSNDDWITIYWDDKSILSVKNNDAFKEISSKFGYKYLTPYNLYYGKVIIEKALKEDKETLLKEVHRKQSEEPNGFYLNTFMQSYGKQLN
jgi:hypothetical protein